MPKRLPIFYSALLLTGVNLLLRLVGTGFQVYISGRIGAEGVGLLQMVLSVGAMALVAGMAGVRTGTMYLTAEELGKGRGENVTWVLSGSFLYSISFSAALGLTLFFTAPWLAENWIRHLETAGALRLYASFLPVFCLSGVMNGYFTAANRIGTLAAVEVGEQAVTMAFTMAALYFWAGSNAARACISVVLGNCCGACFTLGSLVHLRRKERVKTGKRIAVGRRLADTALPLAAADDLKTGINTVENLMVPVRLALCRTVDSPLGAFGVVSGMVFPVLMFPSCILFALTELLIPELARCSAAGSRDRIRYLTKRGLKVSALYGLVFCGLECLLAVPLCEGLYDNGQAGKELMLYALLIPMLYCDLITDAMVKGLGRQKVSVCYNILTSALDVVLLYFLLPEYGMWGYFLSFLLTHLLNFCLSLRLLLSITKVCLPMKRILFALCAAVFAVTASRSLRNPGARAAAYLLLLGSGLCLTGVTGKEDFHWLRGMVKPSVEKDVKTPLPKERRQVIGR